MSKISSVMNMGQRSLMNSQTGLQTVSHNIANKTTEGYSRQRVEMKASAPTGQGHYQIGTGADVNTVQRIVNPHLEKQVQKETEKTGFANGQSYYMSRVEDVFNDQDSAGVSQFLSQFFNAFRDLSNNPESSAIRTQVKESAMNLTKDFKRINEQMRNVQTGINTELEAEIGEINRITQEIGSLNLKITTVEVNGLNQTANDFRDRRDLLVKKLSEKMNIKAVEGKSGAVNITAGNTVVLVADTTVVPLETGRTPERGDKREGDVDILYRSAKEGSLFHVNDQIKGGKLGALLEVRDKVVNGLLDRLDLMAFTVASRVNEVHVRGYDQYGKPTGNFFDTPANLRDASANIDVHDTIRSDASRIASAAIPDAPGDNRVAQVIAALAAKPVMPDGVTSVDEFYKGIVGDIGVMGRKANEMSQQQTNAMEQLKNLRESVSGVSLDEETIKMIEYQKLFDASAKMIKTSDEMLDTIINLKR